MRNINVLMIQPKTPPSFWSHDNSLKAAGFKTVMPPLGLMTVAAMLPENYKVKLADLNVSQLDLQDVDKSDVVFLTGMWIHHDSIMKILDICRERGKTVVAGGPYVQSAYGFSERDNLELERIDHLILYEAENNLPSFLEDFEQGKAKRVYDNKEKPDLALTPPPRFDLIKPNDYASMALQFSRGCPFDCEFCDIIKMFGRVPRTKGTDQFMREVEAVYATGYRGRLFIVDDNFTANKKKVKDMLRRLAAWQEERGYPYLLFTEACMDMAGDDELLDLMVRSGFTSVFIGIESPDVETLRATKKSMNYSCDMSAAIEKIQRAGIEVMGGFILGFDTDTEDVFDRQLDFIRRNGIVQSMVGLLNALPHTELYKRLEREGRLILDNSCRGDNVDTALNFIPKMPEEKLVKGYRRVIMETYDPRNYFARASILLGRFPYMKISKLHQAEPWRKKLSKSKLTNYSNKSKLAFELVKFFFSPFGIQGLLFIIKSLRFGIFTMPISVELTFRGIHYMNVTKRITNNAAR
ncbi:MAG: B12-binding domain-containing radical SAM protein [Syntrophaceae bacterium]|nr:B12-binding domain-containing radical SAM protein [Syntrophaceae bacterium]